MIVTSGNSYRAAEAIRLDGGMLIGGVAIAQLEVRTKTPTVHAATGGNGGATDGGADGSQPGCRTDKIEFTQQTGCANDGSVEFCLPAPDAAALAEVLAIDATIFCEWGSSGRVGCNTLTEQLCLLPANCLGNTAPMSNASWQTVCQLAALDVVAKIAPTFYE